MSEQMKPYVPSPAEVKKAENMMSDEQREMSEKRPGEKSEIIEMYQKISAYVNRTKEKAQYVLDHLDEETDPRQKEHSKQWALSQIDELKELEETLQSVKEIHKL